MKRRLVAGRAAQSVKSPAAVAAARAAGQASAVAHMGAHALGTAAYAAKAAALAAGDHEAARSDEVRWQLDHMTADVRSALASLPPLGQDSSGPLGKGLLASGALAVTIHEIQAELGSGTR
ncbi:putative immunity protein [Saccharomonospora sp. NPDC046836]|uniref:putative immunity protein n=1 Tax=Saccharomonospora sp. NPDC046836 TaxID=3156921 RepID=UPI003405A91B